MIRREVSNLILTTAKRHPLLMVAGPRHAGKSELVKRLLPSHTYIDLESPNNLAFAKGCSEDFFGYYKGDIVIDEFHRAPEIFKHIKPASTDRRVVLITSRKPAQLASRYVPANNALRVITLLPPSINELCTHNVSLERDEYIHRGFIPDAYKENADHRETQYNYLTALLQQDIAPLIRMENREAFKRFFRLLAGRVGLALNLDTFADTVGVPYPVIVRWMRLLEAHFVIFSVPIYPNCFRIRSKAIRASKFYFTDVGIAAYLLKIETPEQVRRHPAVGNLFENLVVAEALKTYCNCGLNTRMYYYRDRNGFEIDLILPKGRAILPIEIKASSRFNSAFADNVKRFHAFAENILDGYVVYGGEGSDRVDGAKYVNFRDVGEIVRG